LDISFDALEVAKENAKLNNVEVNFINADIFKYKSDKKYDVIVSNPPYVLESEKSQMKQNVLDFEPGLALFVKDIEPLKYYTEIFNFSQNNLRDKGFLFFEINNKVEKPLSDGLILNNFNFKIYKDHNGFKRCIFARK
jgi:release factor glutamine methyltransferase